MLKRVVIIGSGLGGLSCGVILAKNGYDVTVLEQQPQAGGCLQCFSRRGAKFETGMHFIGSAAEGQVLDRLMDMLEMKDDIKLAPLDADGYEVIALGGRQYRFAIGREAFIEKLAADFPHQRAELGRYFDLVERVANASSLHTMKEVDTAEAVNTEFQLRSVDEVIGEVISDPLLAKVLVGDLPLYAGVKGATPFSVHAFITDFYNQSAFRIVGGSDKVAESMIRTIGRYGGQVCTRQKVVHIDCNEERAVGVTTADGRHYAADIVISDAHPMRTLEMIDSRLIRPAFRHRINSMPQTIGGFSVYLEFADGMVPYLNYNYYGYEGDTPWGCEQYDEQTWPKGFLYMHFCQQEHQEFATTGVVISYMRMDEVERWRGTSIGHRGADYEAFKERKANQLLDTLERHFPGLRSKVKHYYTSTPLTYLDYTGTENGSMYGVAKDVRLGPACRVLHRTKIPNVLQTGQNINSHGMLGVLVGTLVTCREIERMSK